MLRATFRIGNNHPKHFFLYSPTDCQILGVLFVLNFVFYKLKPLSFTSGPYLWCNDYHFIRIINEETKEKAITTLNQFS